MIAACGDHHHALRDDALGDDGTAVGACYGRRTIGHDRTIWNGAALC
jgi:hypothetical protein